MGYCSLHINWFHAYAFPGRARSVWLPQAHDVRTNSWGNEREYFNLTLICHTLVTFVNRKHILYHCTGLQKKPIFKFWPSPLSITFGRFQPPPKDVINLHGTSTSQKKQTKARWTSLRADRFQMTDQIFNNRNTEENY